VDEEGKPIHLAEVRATFGEKTRTMGRFPTGIPAPVRAGLDGRWRLEGLELRPHRVTMEAAGFVPADLPGLVPEPGGGEERRIVLSRGETFAGEVVDENGEPVGQAVVSVHSEEGTHGQTRTGADGRFAIRGLGRWTHRVHAGQAEYLRWEPRDLGAPFPASYRIALVKGLTIEGVVLDFDGAPATNVMVQADYRASEGTAAAVTATDAEGRFRLLGLAPGEHDLSAVSLAHRFAVLPRVVAGSSGVELRAVRTGVVAGRVVSPSGAPVGGAVVRVVGPKGAPPADVRERPRQCQTDAEGRFRIEGLLGDAFDLEAGGMTQFARTRVRGVPRDSADVVIALVEGLTIRGTIAAGQGQPPQGISVRAADAEGLCTYGTVREDGRFEIPYLGAGAHTVTAEALGGWKAEVEDVAAGTSDLRLDLRPPERK